MCSFGGSSRCFAHIEARVNSCTGLGVRNRSEAFVGFLVRPARLIRSPEAGTQAFTAALTDEQRLHYNQIAADEDKLAYQQELREQTITSRRTRHAAQFPLSDNLMSLIFLVQSDLNEQQRELFCLVHEHPSDSNASVYLSPIETAVLRTFCRFPHRCCRPNITYRKRSTFYVLEEGETEEGEYGFWVLDEETGEEGFTGLYTENEFWVLGAKGSYSKRRIYGRSFKKGKPKGYGKKGGKDQDPASARGQKVMQHGKMTSKTQLSGEKAKEKAKRARKE